MEFAQSREEAEQKIERLLQQFGEIIVEEQLIGRELTVTVMDDTVFPIIEIKPKKGFYNYENKYTKGNTEYLIVDNLTHDVENICKSVAHKAYKSLGCTGCARVDIILRNNIPYILEVNTMPGMTETSLVPKSAKAQGISFEDLVKLMIGD